MSLPNWDKQLAGFDTKIKSAEEKLRKLKASRAEIAAKKEAYDNKELHEVMAKSNLSPAQAAKILKEALQTKLEIKETPHEAAKETPKETAKETVKEAPKETTKKEPAKKEEKK